MLQLVWFAWLDNRNVSACTDPILFGLDGAAANSRIPGTFRSWKGFLDFLGAYRLICHTHGWQMETYDNKMEAGLEKVATSQRLLGPGWQGASMK